MNKLVGIGAALILSTFALIAVLASENGALSGAADIDIPIPQGATKVGEAEYKALNGPANEVLGYLVNLKLKMAGDDRRDVTAWIVRHNSAWKLAGQWSVDVFNHKEEGERNESQTFSAEPVGSLRRFVKRNNIEGIKTLCGDECKCVIWQSKTICTVEDETLRWDNSTQSVVRVAFKKWYVTQPEENVLSICKKLDIPVGRFTSLYYLNPGIQKLDKLPEGMKLLVEKSPK